MSSMMLACNSQPGPRVDDQPRDAANAEADGVVSVLSISKPEYDAREERGDGPALRAECGKWAIDRSDAESFFRLGERISPEAAHHEFSHLPCSVKGKLAAEGKTWDFEINAAATATWIHGDEIRNFGCSDPACEPLVLMMPDGADGPEG